MAEKVIVNEEPKQVYTGMPEATPVSNMNGVDHNGLQVGEWSSGLFSCFDNCIPNTCMSCCCGCVTMAQVAARLGWADYGIALVILIILNLSGFGGVVIWAIVFGMRIKMRETFNIPGNLFADCCASFCCGCCSIAQMATHVQSYQPGKCDFSEPPTLPGYSSRTIQQTQMATTV